MQSCADSGIGGAVGREGADVLISYLNEEQDAQETARVVRESGEKCVTVAGDIGDESHCREIVQRAAQPAELVPASYSWHPLTPALLAARSSGLRATLRFHSGRAIEK